MALEIPLVPCVLISMSVFHLEASAELEKIEKGEKSSDGFVLKPIDV